MNKEVNRNEKNKIDNRNVGILILRFLFLQQN